MSVRILPGFVGMSSSWFIGDPSLIFSHYVSVHACLYRLDIHLLCMTLDSCQVCVLMSTHVYPKSCLCMQTSNQLMQFYTPSKFCFDYMREADTTTYLIICTHNNHVQLINNFKKKILSQLHVKQLEQTNDLYLNIQSKTMKQNTPVSLKCTPAKK